MATVTGSVPVLALGAMLLVGMTPTEPRLPVAGDPCHAASCAAGADIADADASIAAQVAAITKGRDCFDSDRNQPARSVVVHDVGSTEVREVSMATGWKLATSHKVWVDAKCA